LIDEFAEKAVAIGETVRVHALRRLHGLRGFFGKGQVHGAELAAEESGGGEGLQLLAFAHAFKTLADVDEGGHHLVARAEHLGHPGADMRTGDRLRRHIAGVPVILMTRVQNAAEVRLHGAADERAAIHHLRDVFEPLADFDAIDARVDRREGAEHAFDLQTLLKGQVALRIKGVGRGHAACHPQKDARICLGRGMGDAFARFGPDRARFAGHPRRSACGGEFLEKLTADEVFGEIGVDIVHGNRNAPE
jgi:hypothetical protein